MGIGSLVGEYIGPVVLVALAIGGLLALFALLARRGVAPSVWGLAKRRWPLTVLLSVLLLFATGISVSSARQAERMRIRDYTMQNLISPSNLIANPLFAVSDASGGLPSWVVSGTVTHVDNNEVILAPGARISSSVVPVKPGARYWYSVILSEQESSVGNSQTQIRVLWLDLSLHKDVSWNDSLVSAAVSNLEPMADTFSTNEYVAPPNAANLRLEISNLGSKPLDIWAPYLACSGVNVEQHPNGALGALAFSFDWESAMGGAVHSQGATDHDPQAAAEHGLRMRQGADWLHDLFVRNGISATFYSTGYNLLDGNMERRKFDGDPIYKWARSKYGWASDYWTSQSWFSDDPYGTYKTDPAWYFGDQTRRLLAAGHEIASHTFAHIYVRGSNIPEMDTDLNEWSNAAQSMGVPAATTFAFPWRSSNSLNADMYDLLYKHGIRAVTRLYAPDVKDQYTVAGVEKYPNIAVIPDFLLGAPSSTASEEAGGAPIGQEVGLHVISETLARRGTTSFWQHPEQLGDDPSLAKIRQAWQTVTEAAAKERNRGRLWVATVADITAYQTGVMSVTTQLDNGFLGFGGWKLNITNNSGKELHGVTLTMPGDVQRASSGGAGIRTILHPDDVTIRMSEVNKPVFPARQLVLDTLKPGVTTLDIEWAPGGEPPR